MMSGGGVPEGVSLDGRAPLLRRGFPPERREALESDLTEAEATHAASPSSVEATVWHARRLGYLDRYTEAIDVLTAGIETHPTNPEFFRHRGHRYITVRRYTPAIVPTSLKVDPRNE